MNQTTPINVVTPNSTQKAVDETSGFYRRPLPFETCVAFESPEGRRLFKESLELGTMETYFSLAANFVTQADPATCGLGTLSMVLNSLEVDPDRIWKGSWRWYSEDMLDCCLSMEVIKQAGITLDEFACTAICNGAAVTTTRVYLSEPIEDEALNSEASKFREQVKLATRTVETKLVVSYDRGALLQTGTGHFSPIGGYHEPSDQVLIMDVARFKYPPHWVPLKLLVKSMSALDPTTQLPRGYITLKRSEVHAGAVLRVNIGRSQWKQFADSFKATLLFRLKKGIKQPTNLVEYLKLSCNIISETQVMPYLVQYVESLDKLAEEHQIYIKQVLKELAETSIMKAITSFPEACCRAYDKPGYKEIATIFLLAQGPIGMDLLAPETAQAISAVYHESIPTEAKQEVESLAVILQAINYACLCRDANERKQKESAEKAVEKTSEKACACKHK